MIKNSSQMLKPLLEIAKEAGKIIMVEYSKNHRGEPKADGTPVTQADLNADDFITKSLHNLYPHIPVVSEEKSMRIAPESLRDKDFFLVDPLDGTKEFIKKNGEFTVNIAFMKNGSPLLGVIHAPSLNESWFGAIGEEAKKEDANGRVINISARSPKNLNGIIATRSRSHDNNKEMQKWLDHHSVAEVIICGSSLKFCKIAEGLVDVYPRFTPTMEWDTAAAHAILLASGGHVCTLDGAELTYCKDGLINPYFIASGKDWK